MRHYTHLSIEEREKLYLRRGQGAKLREIARELGRSVSTISRELKRNERPRHPYSPSQAQKRYEKRRKACAYTCKRRRVRCGTRPENSKARRDSGQLYAAGGRLRRGGHKKSGGARYTGNAPSADRDSKNPKNINSLLLIP